MVGKDQMDFLGGAEVSSSHQGCGIYPSREYTGFCCTSYEINNI